MGPVRRRQILVAGGTIFFAASLVRAQKPRVPLSSTGSTGITPLSGTWTKLNQGPQTVRVTVPYAGQGFWNSCPLSDGSVFFSSGTQPSVWKFNPVTGLWARTNSNTTDWWKAGIDQSENYSMCFDPDRGRVLMGVGGPYAWRMAGQPDVSSPLNGDVEYHLDIDEWFTPYPHGNSTYVPSVPADTAHWDATGKGKNVSYFDGAAAYWQRKQFGFGSYSTGAGALRYRDFSTGIVTVLTNDVPVRTGPRWFCQGGIDRRSGRLWQFANNFDYCTWDWGSPTGSSWVHHAIVNPPVIPPLTGQSNTDSGALMALDESRNRIIIWVGLNAPSGGWSGTQAVQKTWTVDLATLICSPVTVTGSLPPAVSGAGQNLYYNPQRQKVQLLVGNPGTTAAEIWEYT